MHDSSSLGTNCDFGDTDHVAVISEDSIVKTCELCHAIICSGCYTG